MWPNRIETLLGQLKSECTKAEVDYAIMLACKDGREVTTSFKFNYAHDIEKCIPVVQEYVRDQGSEIPKTSLAKEEG